MSQLLAKLLEVNPTLLGKDLEKLENASGRESVDIRLATDIMSRVRQKSRELGLDPGDTTGEELYHAILGIAKLHDKFLFDRVGGVPDDPVPVLLGKISRVASGVKGPKTAWVLKYSVAKRLLKQNPPKKVMKYLGYKSLDSLLKREPVSQIFAGILLVETAAWHENFIKSYKNLSQMDFETRNIDIVCLDSKKWAAGASDYVHRNRQIICAIRELGVVLILPTPLKYRPGLTLTILPQLLHHTNEVRLYSSYYKLHQMQPDLGVIIAASLLYDLGNHVYLAGNKVHWRVVQRHFGSHGSDKHPEILEPHVQPDDFSWRKVEGALLRLEPALHFWQDTDYAAGYDGKPISLNILDAALNLFNDLSYSERTYRHAQDSLWNELYVRYLSLPALEQQVLKQIDYEATSPEVIAMLRGA